MMDFTIDSPERALMKTKSKPNTGKQPQSQTLRIEFHDPQAQAVFIAGSFNDWKPATTPLLHLSEDRWVKELALPPGRYEYRLVVDGRWICDPAAGQKVSNPFGSMNAVLIVPRRNSETREQP
jgi:1,4-alpha-glucan branching enzyme